MSQPTLSAVQPEPQSESGVKLSATYAPMLQALPDPGLLVTHTGIICAVNPAFSRLVDISAPQLTGRRLADLVTQPPEKLLGYLQNCAGTRQPLPGALTLRPDLARESTLSAPAPESFRCTGAVIVPRTAQNPQQPALILLRLRTQESAVDRFVVLNRTIEELNQEIRERRQAEARLKLLAELSIILADSLDHRLVLQNLVEQIVGPVADWAVVYIREDSGEIVRAATTHVNPEKLAIAQYLRDQSREYPIPAPFVTAIETGVTYFSPQFDVSQPHPAINNVAHRSLLAQLNPHSFIVVPLRARGHTLGALSIAWTESARYYTQDDVVFMEDLARRAALVVENARLFEEARAAEARLREFNQSLERLVADRTFELERSNHELDQFAYVASHDLKAPLRAIQHLADWLEEDAGDTLPPNAQVHLPRMRQRITRMERLLDDLLTYSRAGRHFHTPERVESYSLIENVVELLAPPPGFQVHIDPDLPALVAERVPLETVFRNLINNAIKHHHDPTQGHVRISARRIAPTSKQLRSTGSTGGHNHPPPATAGADTTHNTDVHSLPASADSDALIEFSVADNGPGIASEFHQRIFEIFQSLKPRDHTEGSGIGLAVVKKIIERRGGTIYVDSALDAGATFRFTWPLVPTAREQV